MSAYPAAVAIAIFSLLIVFLLVPPLWWHLRNCNIGATSVIIWIIIMNTITLVNAILWPNDDFNGFLGQGLCDVEVKLQIASQIAFSASFACVLRALATVLDTKRLTIGQTKMQKRKNMTIDLIWCVGFPALQMIFHYIVQSNRYYLFGIAGCVPGASNSWLTVLLILVPPVIWVVICAIFDPDQTLSLSTIVSANTIQSCTSKSRFLRLFLLCVVWIFGNVPVQCYVFYVSMGVLEIRTIGMMFMIPNIGAPSLLYHLSVRYSTIATSGLASGVIVFLFFGFGTEALQMYRDGLKAIGLVRLVPDCLKKSRKEDLPGINGSQDRIWKRQRTQSSSQDMSGYTLSTNSISAMAININLVEVEKSSESLA